MSRRLPRCREKICSPTARLPDTLDPLSQTRLPAGSGRKIRARIATVPLQTVRSCYRITCEQTLYPLNVPTHACGTSDAEV